jgi:DNA-binding response OmpR family regulator
MKTILVADDKTNIRNLVRDYLEAENFRVVIAAWSYAPTDSRCS